MTGGDQGLRDAIVAAIGKADAGFGYSFNLTSLIDGVATHTLKMDGFDPVNFEDREDGYELIEERRNRVRGDAIMAALSSSPPSEREVKLEAALRHVLKGALSLPRFAYDEAAALLSPQQGEGTR